MKYENIDGVINSTDGRPEVDNIFLIYNPDQDTKDKIARYIIAASPANPDFNGSKIHFVFYGNKQI